jgi:hypothetical protein
MPLYLNTRGGSLIPHLDDRCCLAEAGFFPGFALGRAAVFEGGLDGFDDGIILSRGEDFFSGLPGMKSRLATTVSAAIGLRSCRCWWCRVAKG